MMCQLFVVIRYIDEFTLNAQWPDDICSCRHMANFNEVVEMGGSLFQVNISYFQGGPLQKKQSPGFTF